MQTQFQTCLLLYVNCIVCLFVINLPIYLFIFPHFRGIQVTNLSPQNLTSQVAEAVVNKLENFTSSQNLTSSQVTETIDILDTLVKLQEKALENGENVTLSDAFVEVR